MTTTAIATVSNLEQLPTNRERIYVGIDVGYRHHVAVASPLSVFNAQRNPNGWRQVKTVRFASDAAGFSQLNATWISIRPSRRTSWSCSNQQAGITR